MILIFLIVLGLMGTWWAIDGLLLIAWGFIELIRQLIVGDETKSD